MKNCRQLVTLPLKISHQALATQVTKGGVGNNSRKYADESKRTCHIAD